MNELIKLKKFRTCKRSLGPLHIPNYQNYCKLMGSIFVSLHNLYGSEIEHIYSDKALQHAFQVGEHVSLMPVDTEYMALFHEISVV